MKIYFARHGKSEANGKGHMTGQMDVSLAEQGMKDAEETAKVLPSDFTLIYSSDLIRCKQTAELINKKFDLPIIYDARLRERSLGSLQGKQWADFSLLKEMDQNQAYDYRPYQGESVIDVRDRIFSLINELRENKNNDKILVVTHSGVIRLLYYLLKDKIPEKIHYASIHEFEFTDAVNDKIFDK